MDKNIYNSIFKKERIVLFTAFAASLVFLLYMMRYGILPYDDGVLLYGAERVLAGDVPYRDFYLVYTPGNLYLLALVFKIFGPSMMIERILNALVCFFIVVFSFFMARKIIKELYMLLIVILLATFCVWINGSFANQNIPLLLSLISGLFFINYLENRSRQFLILTGLFIGLAALFRQDFGLYSFIAVTITIVAYDYLKTSFNKIGRIKYSSKSWLIMLCGTLLIITPPLFYFLMMVPISDLITQFIEYPTRIYPVYLAIPFPSPTNIFNLITIYFPPFILLLTSVWLVFRIKNKSITKDVWIVFFILLLGLIFTNSARVMPYYFHMYMTMIMAIILFSFLTTQYVNIPKIISRFRHKENKNQIMNIIFTIFSILIIFVITSYSIHLVSNTIEDNYIPLNTAKGSGIFVSTSYTGLADISNYIKENIPPNEKIVIISSSNDKIIGNTVILYFLSDRQSGTKYSEMVVGEVTETQIQCEIIDELKKNDVKYIILAEDNLIDSKGATELIKFIKSNYRPFKVIGELQYTNISNKGQNFLFFIISI